MLAVGSEAGGVNPVESREGLSRRAPQAVAGLAGPGSALSCKSMSGIVAHTNVSQFIGKKKILCCKEACHLAPSVGAKES